MGSDELRVDGGSMLAVEVAWSPAPRQLELVSLRLSIGATVADAVRACGWADVGSALQDEPAGLTLAVWGQACDASRPLRDGDRVEILRGLVVDPMEARRERYEAAGGVQALRRKRQAKQPRKGAAKPTSRSSG